MKGKLNKSFDFGKKSSVHERLYSYVKNVFLFSE